MSRYWLRNHYLYNRLLRYDLDTGEYLEHARDELEVDPGTTHGSWTEIEGDVFGVSPSLSGPVFIHNEARFPLLRGQVETTIDDDGHQRRFTLTVTGQRVIDVTFDRDEKLWLDPYDWELNEFFEWFHYLHSAEHAWTLWTQPPDA